MSAAEALQTRVLEDVVASMGTLVIYLGDRMGLFKRLRDTGRCSIESFASAANIQPRYAKEFLCACAVHGYVAHHTDDNTFELLDHQYEVLVNDESPWFIGAMPRFIPALVGVLPDLCRAFTQGGGVEYEKYGADIVDAIARTNKPMFMFELCQQWMTVPAMLDVKAKLDSGALVADLGCGVAYSSIALAKGFPNTRIDAIDVDSSSVSTAIGNVEREGLTQQIAVHLAYGHDLPSDVTSKLGEYDMVMIIEALHDIHNPVEVLRTARSLLNVSAPHACVFVGDENVEEHLHEMLPDGDGTRAQGFAENGKNFRGRMNYSFSVMHCLPQSMVFPGSASIGTCIHPSLVRVLGSEAGFSSTEMVHQNAFFNFYRLTP